MEKSKPRKKRDTSKKREDILDGAIAAFREYGYETVNMDQIAGKSGASKRTLYNHFSSKEELLQAVIRRYLERQQEIKTCIMYDGNESLAQQLSRFIDAELYLVDDPERQILAKVLTSIFLWNTDLAVQTRKSYVTKTEPLVAWLEAASADGRIQKGDCTTSAELFQALVQGLLTWPALFMPRLTDEFITAKKKMVVNLFLKEITAKGEQ
ncbi:MAG: TetR/AcrR family transcriptional regulator [Spirochaetales bacterium]|nr:TetR/AcrR family transcriptional regulator [Spirochaetales bacterium]